MAGSRSRERTAWRRGHRSERPRPVGGRAAGEPRDPVSASRDCARSRAELVPGVPGAACFARPSATEPCVPREGPRVPGDPSREWGAVVPGIRIACEGPRGEAPTEGAGRASALGCGSLGQEGPSRCREMGRGEAEHLHPQFLHLLQRRSTGEQTLEVARTGERSQALLPPSHPVTPLSSHTQCRELGTRLTAPIASLIAALGASSLLAGCPVILWTTLASLSCSFGDIKVMMQGETSV